MAHDDDFRYDVSGLPAAATVKVAFCGDGGCGRPHVLLMDDAGRPFAQFVCPDLKPDGSGFAFELHAEAIKFLRR